MNTMITANEIIEDAKQREELVNRVEVLEKVKGLLLLPNTEFATTQQVAHFYEVDIEAIHKIIQRNSDEVLSDGYRKMTGGEVKRLVVDNMSSSKFINKHGHFVIETAEGVVKIGYASNGIFPKRAILRVGMLLRDSEIAKEVRNQLLNIETKASNEVKIEDATTELELHKKLEKALIAGDVAEVNRLHEEIHAYQNHCIAELKGEIQELQPKADKWDRYLSSDGLITLTTFGTKFLGGISPQKVREKLQDKGIISKQKIDGTYQPTKKYKSYFDNVPYFIGNSDSVIYTLKIKNSAVEFICNLLKEE